MPKLGKLMELFETIAPLCWAESWDNSGLLVGSPGMEVKGVHVALDPAEAVLDEAVTRGANLLVTHHPLFLKPLPFIRPDSFPGCIIRRLLLEDIALFVMHTNFDRSPRGLNAYLAEGLGIKNGAPMESLKETLYKLVVFVPRGYEEKVMAAMAAAGAGHLGGYSDCSFSSEGTGRFRPLDGARPFIGEIGHLEKVEEVRLETVLPTAYRSRVIAAMRQAHPYEEVAFDLYPLAGPLGSEGLGRAGRLSQPLPWPEFFQRVKELFGQGPLPVGGGDPPETVGRIAVLGGSGGGEYLEKAYRCGAEVYLTGDIKYHDYRRAEELGLTLIDIGHFASENLGVRHLAQSIQDTFSLSGISMNVTLSETLNNPYRLME